MLFAKMFKNSDSPFLKGLARLTDPTGIWGANKGLTQEQKLTSLFTGGGSGFVNSLEGNDTYSPANGLGNTPKPDINDYSQNQSIWARYNPRGNY